MNRHLGKKSNWMLLIRLFGIGLFIVILFKVDLKEVGENLKKADPAYFAIALFFQAVMLLFKGLRWHVLMGGDHRMKEFSKTLGIFLESYAIGVVTPGRLGEFTRAGHEDSRSGRWLTIFKVIAERGFDLGIFIFVGCLAFLAFDLVPIPDVITEGIALAAIVLIVLSFVILSGRRIKAYISDRIKLGTKINKLLNMSFDLETRQVWMVLILSLLSNLATFISCQLLAVSVNLGSSFLYTSGAVASAGLLNLLPLTIMGLGTREISLLYLLGEFDSSRVMAFSALMFLTLQAGGGLIALVFGQLFVFLNRKKKLQV